jgi:hypothetical protein
VGVLAVPAGVDVAAGAFAAAVGVEVAAGVLAVTGAGGGCVEDGGVAAAGALPAFVALVAPAAAGVAVSGLAVFCADLAAGVGAAAGAGVVVGAVVALEPTAGIAVA